MKSSFYSYTKSLRNSGTPLVFVHVSIFSYSILAAALLNLLFKILNDELLINEVVSLLAYVF